MPRQSADRELLDELLHQYNEYPDQRERIVAEIEKRFRRPLAILVLDSSGFTRTVHEVGIIHFLALLERLGRIVIPVIERRGGRLLRQEADNFFAVFPDATSAVGCAVEIRHDVDLVNQPLPAAEEIYVSIGVGYGSVLTIGDDDLYGDEMNLTCKLGEDLAERDEILITTTAYDALENPPWQFEQTSFSISGIHLPAYRLVDAP